VVLIVLSGHKDLEHLFAELEWNTIFFFIGLFMVVGALVDVGIMGMVSKWLITITSGHLKAAQFVILWVSSILSAVIDNIPFVATMIPLIKTWETSWGPTRFDPSGGPSPWVPV